MTSVMQNLHTIQQSIAAAKQRFANPNHIQLCAVSKAQSADNIRLAYQAGQTVFGENYLQEAIEKQSKLQDCVIEWHFIGPIQSNKTQLIAQHFDWVQSVDRLKIAQRLSQSRGNTLPALNICLQVNSSQEASKSGANVNDLIDLALQINTLPHLKLRGLMAIPAPCNNFEKQRDQFRQVHNMFQSLISAGIDLDTLSIGMSGDYQAAIAEGATIVRIGTALFGARGDPKQWPNTVQEMQAEEMPAPSKTSTLL